MIKMVKPIHLIFGGSKGLGNDILTESVYNNKEDVICISRTRPVNTAGVSWFYADLTDVESIHAVAEKIEGLMAGVRKITFSIRYRNNEDIESYENAIASYVSEVISVETVLKTMDCVCYDDNCTRSIVIVSSINSSLINEKVPFWYHASKASVKVVGRYYRNRLAKKNINVSVVELGSFVRSACNGAQGVNAGLQKVILNCGLGKLQTSNEISKYVDHIHSTQMLGMPGQCYIFDDGCSIKAVEDYDFD
jgi:NAD(P)-dependent dehydrogenase (short-subunit alcohol dehydrogenase family)